MERLRLRVLGSAAGGGVPQWNCLCDVCRLAWAEDPRVVPRTQASMAVTATGDEWALVNCAPEVLAQMKAFAALHPRQEEGRRRHSPLAAVLLTNGDIDHVAGLLSLRERQAYRLFATPEIHKVLRANPVFDVLADDCVERRAIALEEPFDLVDGVRARIFPVPGKVPLYLEEKATQISSEGELTVGVEISSKGASVFYLPGCSAMTDSLAARLEGADALLFDGTVWRNDEMVVAGVGTKTGLRMGHMPISGEGGSMAALAGLGVGRKIYIHINNTNPILVEDSPERRRVEAAGWEVAHDSMEIAL